MTQPIEHLTQPVGSAVQKPQAVGSLLPPPSPEYLKAKAEIPDGPARYLGIVPPPRPSRSSGLRSTEFWLCTFCAALGTLLCFRWPLPEGLAGALLVGLAAASYAHSRGRVKGRPYVQGKL